MILNDLIQDEKIKCMLLHFFCQMTVMEDILLNPVHLLILICETGLHFSLIIVIYSQANPLNFHFDKECHDRSGSHFLPLTLGFDSSANSLNIYVGRWS